MTDYSPGTLVKCRYREWIVLPICEKDLVILRQLGGTESYNIEEGMTATNFKKLRMTAWPLQGWQP